MCTRSSFNLPVESPPNPSTSNPKRRNRIRSKQPFILEESPVDTMSDQRIMVELLRAPTEGYAEVIVVPLILAEQFELKHSLINMMTLNQFFRLEKDILVITSVADQDSLNSAAGGNLLERHTQDVLTIIENKSKVHNSRNKSVVSQVKSSDANSNSSSEIAKLTHAVNQQTSAVTTTMTVILKQFQTTPPPASVKAVEEILLLVVMLIHTISVSSPMATFSHNLGIIFKDTLQQPQLITIRNMMASFFQMNIASTSGSGSLPSNSIANPKGELKSITTRSGIVLDGPFVPIPPPFINSKEDEYVEETLTDQDLAEYTIKVPPPLVQKPKPFSQRNFFVHQRDPLHPNIPYPSRMHDA
nr:reverse transcriptase domain-containing protein [Tanacetum cinerariifolium]